MGKSCPVCNTAGIDDQAWTCPVCGAEFSENKPHTTEADGQTAADPEPLKAKGTLNPWRPENLPPPVEKADPISDLATEPVLAWEMPGGLFTRLWLTCWQVLFQPKQSFARLGMASYAKPLWFVYLLGSIYYIFGFPFGSVRINQQTLLEVWFEKESLAGALPSWREPIIFLGVFLVAAPLLAAFSGLLVSWPIKMFLWLYGAPRQPLLATYKAYMYWFGSSLVPQAIFNFPLTIILVFLKLNGFPASGFSSLTMLITVLSVALFVWLFFRLAQAVGSANKTTTGKAVLAMLSMAVVIAAIVNGYYIFIES